MGLRSSWRCKDAPAWVVTRGDQHRPPRAPWVRPCAACRGGGVLGARAGLLGGARGGEGRGSGRGPYHVRTGAARGCGLQYATLARGDAGLVARDSRRRGCWGARVQVAGRAGQGRGVAATVRATMTMRCQMPDARCQMRCDAMRDGRGQERCGAVAVPCGSRARRDERRRQGTWM